MQAAVLHALEEVSALKIRIKFEKTGHLKYVGHLDTMRYFQKAMRRAGVDIAFSGGFSPHMIMSFAAPLGVGIESFAEYLDIEVNSLSSSEEMIDSLNAVMVDGFRITEFRLLPDNSKTAMSVVSCADYTMVRKKEYPLIPVDELKKAIHDFYEAKESVIITKETKNGSKEMDLKKLVFAFDVSLNEDNEICFFLKVNTGSTDNLKPELVMEHFHRFIGVPFEKLNYKLYRHEIYSGSVENGFIPLSEMGEIIK